METLRRLTSIGLMSGTSIDGVDAALVETDGVDVFANKVSLTRHYDDSLKEAIRTLLGEKGQQDKERLRKIEVLLTMFHVQAVKDLLSEAGKTIKDIDVIGFHGHTVFHNPAYHITRQIGDAALLANELKVPVVSRFRNVDVKAGGEGAPLEPAYLMAISEDMPKPLGFVNIGGVANITVIGVNGEMLAFHTGSGN
ncbi:MAG: anhydro-N-acetylmuramic acid kinase, partial [Alphaproteobacteria bacterium]|nr:anhydro-N-acetylmuramic acid kinase [Alphaproteobacteria bacterium]